MATAPGGPYESLIVFGGTIDGQRAVGIVASRLDLADVTVGSDAALALIIHKRLSFTNVTLQLGPMAEGIEAGNSYISGTGLTLIGGGVGVEQGRLKIDNVTASGYGRFVYYGRRVKLSHASLSGGMRAIDAPPVQSDTAIRASRITLIRSSVTGNNGLDLDADYRPRLDASSTCQTSNGWGVCAND